MENYIQKIISVFTASKHSEKVIEEVHQWLVDKEHSDDKKLCENSECRYGNMQQLQ